MFLMVFTVTNEILDYYFNDYAGVLVHLAGVFVGSMGVFIGSTSGLVWWACVLNSFCARTRLVGE